MHNLALAIKSAITKILPMHIVDLNDAKNLDSIATPSDVVYMTIEQVQLVEDNSIRITEHGQPYGNTYEVLYRLSMRHENALSTNLMTDILDLRLSGMESRITRDALFIGRNVYYMMSITAIAILAYEPSNQSKITRIIISVNGRDKYHIDIDSEEKNANN